MVKFDSTMYELDRCFRVTSFPTLLGSLNSVCTAEAQDKDTDGNPLQVLGQSEVTVDLDGKAGGINLKVVVTNVPQLNLLE